MRRFAGIAGLIASAGCAGNAAAPLAPDAVLVDGMAYSTTVVPSTSEAGHLVAEMTIRNQGTSARSIQVLGGAPLWVQFRRQSDDSLTISSPTGALRVAEIIVVPAGGVKRLSRVITAAELAAAPSGVYVVSVRLMTPSDGASVVQTKLLSLPLTVLR